MSRLGTTVARLAGSVAAAAVVSAAGAASASAHGGDATLVHACINNGGNVKIVGPSDACGKNERAQDWPTTSSVGGGTVRWDQLVNVPAGLSDGDDDGSAALRAQLAADDGAPNEPGDLVSFSQIKDLTAAGDGRITGDFIRDGSVLGADVANGTIEAGDLADGAVTGAKIANGTIEAGDLADGAVTGAKIADGTIQAGDLADGAVTGAKIVDGTIQGGDLADGSVSSAKIANGTIEGRDLGNVVNMVTDTADPPPIPAGTRLAYTWTPGLLAGVKPSDLVTLSPPASLEPGLLFAGYDVLAAGQITIYLYNIGATALDPAPGTWTVRYLDTDG
jgi:hypothetical protein